MKCLRCDDVEMDMEPRGEGTDVVEVDVCPECGGMWLDREELERIDDNMFLDLEEVALEDVAPSEGDRALHCPRCEGALALRKAHPAGFDRVVIDTCPQCRGFWLDRGELAKMKDVSDRLLVASLLESDD
ncbi:MAG: zf-TFIIB domain-containing protein [Polyangia bacterium]